jgi:nucleotide-binding universal stress UspA family protein
VTEDPKVETILVGTALDAGSDRVVIAARDLARVLGARIRLLHAEIRPADLSGAGGEAVQVHRHAEAEGALAEQAVRLGLSPPELAGTVCAEGPPHRLLVEAARHGGADLIVVGAHEGLGLSGMFGSTASRVLRNATRPVLVVRGELGRPPKRVLVPVDLSSLSADAFRAGLALVDSWAGGGIEAEALFVLTEADRRSHEAGRGGDAHAAAVASLARFVAAHRGDFPGEIAERVAEGDPRSEILYRIGVSQPDLVVLGTHGRSGFELLLMGSVAEGVVRETGCSSLVIPPDAALRAALARKAGTRRTTRDRD